MTPAPVPTPSPELDLEFPVADGPGPPPPRLSNEEYLRFIEFNREVMRTNGTAGRLLSLRHRPVERMFALD